MKIITVLLCLGTALSVVGCGDSLPKGAVSAAPPPSVTVVAVQEHEVKESVEEVARTESTARVEVRAQVTGILKSRAFEEGTFVNAGDLLLVIDPAQFEADLAVATAAVTHAKASQKKAALYLSRLKGMRSGAVAAVDLDAAISEAAVADANLQEKEAQWQLAKLDLDHTRITAPISGHIGASRVDVGNLVSSHGDALATIVQLDPIEVAWSVSERLMTTIKTQQLKQAEAIDINERVIPSLKLSNGDIYSHAGKINFWDNEVNPRTGTITIRARFPNPDNLLIPGQFVTVLLHLTGSQQRLLIPQAAVQQDIQGYFVLVVRPDNTVEQRQVELGNRLGTAWIVNQGLESGEWVIHQGLEKVRPGSVVNAEKDTTFSAILATGTTDNNSATDQPSRSEL